MSHTILVASMNKQSASMRAQFYAEPVRRDGLSRLEAIEFVRRIEALPFTLRVGIGLNPDNPLSEATFDSASDAARYLDWLDIGESERIISVETCETIIPNASREAFVAWLRFINGADFVVDASDRIEAERRALASTTMRANLTPAEARAFVERLSEFMIPGPIDIVVHSAEGVMALATFESASDASFWLSNLDASNAARLSVALHKSNAFFVGSIARSNLSAIEAHEFVARLVALPFDVRVDVSTPEKVWPFESQHRALSWLGELDGSVPTIYSVKTRETIVRGDASAFEAWLRLNASMEKVG